MEKIRLLVIEHNRLLRDGIAAMLKKHPDLKLMAACGSPEDAVRNAQESKPHVILLDPSSQGENHLRVLEMVKKEFPQAKVVITSLTIQEDIIELIKAGACGFILKDATCGDFLKTIRSVAQGAKVLPSSLAGSLFSQIINRGGRIDAQLNESVRITKREQEIIEFIAEGLSNKEIAQRLHVSIHTVKSHVHNLLEKLALHNRLQVAAYADTRVPARMGSAFTLKN